MSYSIFSCNRILYITFTLFILLLITSCSEGEHAVQIAKYGEIVSYRTSKSVVYPDFTLQFIAKKTIQSKTEGESVSYSFQLTGGGPGREIEWVESRNRVGAIDQMGGIDQFEHNERTYYLELKSSSFLDKTLKDGELIVWTKIQAGEHRENINKIKARIRQKMIDHATRKSKALDQDTQQ